MAFRTELAVPNNKNRGFSLIPGSPNESLNSDRDDDKCLVGQLDATQPFRKLKDQIQQ